MSSQAVSHNPSQSFLLHILALMLMLVPGTTVIAKNEGGGELYSIAEATASDNNNNKITKTCHSALCEAQSRNPHVTPHPTANAVPDNPTVSATQALDKLERKLDQRLRVAATHFANNTAQGLVQQSLPQMLLGGHWLTEKFQFLSTLAWQSGDDKGGILGELDLVVPLYGMRDASGVDQYGFFLQPGLVSWEADNGDRRLDVNVGLVYRQRIRERIAVGASVFYDHNIDSDLKRIGAGADVVSRYTYLSLNYYEPLDGWRTGERLGYEERALRGVDINIEQALLATDWVVAASGGYWKGYDSDNRHGEWQLAGSVGVRYYPLDYLSVYADYVYHHKDVDTDRFAAGVEFSYPGKHRGVSENEIDLWRPVTREKRILYAEREAFPTRITVRASSDSISINAGEYTPDQLQLTVAIDRALAADLQLRFALLVNGVAESAQRLEDNGIVTIPRGQTQVVITYDRTDLERLFGNPPRGGQYVLRLENASLALAGGAIDVSGAIMPQDSGGQVMITVAAAGSQMSTPTLTLVTDPSAVDPGNDISLVITSDMVVAGMLTLPLTISDRASSGLVSGYFTDGLTQSVSANFNGSTTATVTIATVRLGGTARTYTITLGSGTGYNVGGDRTAEGTINALRPTLTLVPNVANVRNGEDISLMITSNIPVTISLTVALTIVGRGGFPVDAADFTNGLSQSLRAEFNGSTAATVMIGTVNDGDRFTESYRILLTSSNGYRAGGANLAIGIIRNR